MAIFTLVDNNCEAEWTSGGTFYGPPRAFCEVGYTNKRFYTDFLFKSVNIPQGSTINTATFTIRTYNQYVNAAQTRIWMNDADNPSLPTSYSDANGRALTTAYTDWDTSAYPTWSYFQARTSGSIAAIVQEIVDRAGWTSGNNMLLRWGARASAGSWTTICGRAYSSSYAAYLTITWTPPATGHPATRRMGGVPFARQSSQPGRRIW